MNLTIFPDVTSFLCVLKRVKNKLKIYFYFLYRTGKPHPPAYFTVYPCRVAHTLASPLLALAHSKAAPFPNCVTRGSHVPAATARRHDTCPRPLPTNPSRTALGHLWSRADRSCTGLIFGCHVVTGAGCAPRLPRAWPRLPPSTSTVP
jgi:hypothetical protein